MRTAIVLCVLLANGGAFAAETEAVAEKTLIAAGLKGGLVFPQLNTPLSTSFTVHLEAAGYLPFWGSRLGLVFAVGYRQAAASGSGEDARLPEGVYTWEATRREVLLDVGPSLRVMDASCAWNLSFAAGPRIAMTSFVENGSAGGESFGEHDERATLPGMFFGVQGEYRLGPGAVFAELSLGVAFEDLRTAGNVSAASLDLLLGYRFWFSF
ncbi:MAG: hypothetical protein GYA21_15390 [Myxococcales bacterium]|nr:hypothetical protein [Myxococcales bacterium]